MAKTKDKAGKTKIKRVKRAKKKVSTEQKVLAGLGVGATLLGGLGAVSPKTQTTEFVRTTTDEKATAGSRVKESLGEIFGIRKARASEEPTPPPPPPPPPALPRPDPPPAPSAAPTGVKFAHSAPSPSPSPARIKSTYPAATPA